MGFPTVGSFYNAKSFGFPWTQPNNPPSFNVSPPLPVLYPQEYQGFPQAPFSFEGLYSLICGHWVNCVECYEEYDPTTKMQAAILVCPACGVVQLIVEPYNLWENDYYGLYPINLGNNTFTNPSVNPNLP